MRLVRWVAVLLIAAGAVGIVRGGFSYTKDTHQANIPPLSFQLTEMKYINIPQWLSLVAIAGGAILLVGTRKKK